MAARAQERKRESGSKDEITTDRPDFTEASSTVGKGRQQIESGYTFSRNRDAGILSNHAYPELLLRVGVISDALELRVGQSFIRSTAASVDGDEVVSTGAEDLYLGVKLALSSQRQTWPEVALVVQSTVPTGTHGFTAGRMLPGANLLYGWELGSGAFSLGGSSQVNGALNDDRHTYAEFAQAVTVGWVCGGVRVCAAGKRGRIGGAHPLSERWIPLQTKSECAARRSCGARTDGGVG